MNLPASVTFIGHATLLIEMDGVRILTDPVLRRHVGGFLRRQVPVPLAKVRDVDLVLISHLHFDHLDLPSLRLLSATTQLLVPKGSAAFLYNQGFAHVKEISVGEQMTMGALQIEATPAQHDGARQPFGPVVESLGFLVRGQQNIYFAGDTDLFPEMSRLESNLDLALLPVWGWGPTLGVGHMDPHRAAQALTLLKPRRAMPIHWGTLYPLGMSYLRPHFLHTPPRLFAQYAQALAPDVQVHIVEPGQALTLLA